jgi:hypothetical protein
MRLHLLAVLAAALTLAACGGSDDPSSGGAGTTTTTAAAEADQDAARVRLQECLRENGVDLGKGIPSVDQEQLEKALEACDRHRQEAFADLSDEDRQELQDQLTELTQCLRDQGVDVPDIQLDSGPGVLGQFDRNDPELQEALDACRDTLPERGRRP